MANKVKDLKNISTFGKLELAKWGIIGSVVLLAYFIVAAIVGSIVGSHALWIIFGIVGLVLGVLFAILGVFGIISVVKQQDGKFWWLFLIGTIFAVLMPLGWFWEAGIALSVLAGVTFLVYYLLEKK